MLTALKASFTGMFGLHESTKTLDAMKEGMSKSLEDLAKIGDKVQEAAVRAGYGPTIRADAVKMLVDSVVGFQERSGEIIAEMRKLATQNSAEIREAVEAGKKRVARLAAADRGAARAGLIRRLGQCCTTRVTARYPEDRTRTRSGPSLQTAVEAMLKRKRPSPSPTSSTT